ncbi:MAG: hypothetical protein ACIALR_14715 [Blastopirellula sp. JB062]
MDRIIQSLAFAAFATLLGCQGNNSQLNPFAAYGPQRVPPPATGSYSQPGTTAPYYQPQTGGATLGTPSSGTYAPPGGTLAPPPAAGAPAAAPALPNTMSPPPTQYPSTGAPANGWRGSSVDQTNSNIQLTGATEPVQSTTTPVPASSGLKSQGMAPNEPASGLQWNAVSP